MTVVVVVVVVVVLVVVGSMKIVVGSEVRGSEVVVVLVAVAGLREVSGLVDNDKGEVKVVVGDVARVFP